MVTAAVAMSVVVGYGPACDPIEIRSLYPSEVYSVKVKKEQVIEFKQTFFFYLRSFVNEEKLPPMAKSNKPIDDPTTSVGDHTPSYDPAPCLYPIQLSTVVFTT